MSTPPKKRRLLRAFVFLAIIGVAVVIMSALLGMKPPPEKKEVVKQDVLIDALELTGNTVDFSVTSQGNVQPRTRTVLSSELSGTVVSVSDKFVAGGLFAKDEVLMRIDPTNYQVAVDQARALLDQRKIEYDGALRLKEKGYRAEADLASAAASLASARAGVVRARRDLERTMIRLPYDGLVSSKDVDVGQYVNPGTRLGITFATDAAEVRLPLTDQDLAFLELSTASVDSAEIADGPEVTLEATHRGRAHSWPARIVRSEGVVDEKTRVTYAVARIDDPYALAEAAVAPPLPVGTFVRARIAGMSLDNIIRVPRSALRGRDELLFVDEENLLRIRNVEVMRTDSQYAYLTSGADAGERIVLTAIESPINGMKVRVSGEEEETRNAEADEDQDDADVPAAAQEGA